MNIPKNIKAAGAKLLKLDGIVTASEWERAAIVYAFTYMHEHGGDRSKVNNDLGMSFAEFAIMGFVGLKSKNTVQKFYENWQAAVDAGEALVTMVTGGTDKKSPLTVDGNLQTWPSRDGFDSDRVATKRCW